ncbi:MAG: hypothetical protein ACYC5N_00290 [Endomicrobiales bacterium]
MASGTFFLLRKRYFGCTGSTSLTVLSKSKDLGISGKRSFAAPQLPARNELAGPKAQIPSGRSKSLFLAAKKGAACQTRLKRRNKTTKPALAKGSKISENRKDTKKRGE